MKTRRLQTLSRLQDNTRGLVPAQRHTCAKVLPEAIVNFVNESFRILERVWVTLALWNQGLGNCVSAFVDLVAWRL